MRIPMLAAAALLATSGIAAAETGPYVAVSGGIESADDETIRGANAAGQARDINVAFDSGEYLGFSVGYIGEDMPFGRLRGEVEASFRKSEVEGLSLNGVARQFNPTSEVSIASAMVNAYLDSPVLADRFRVYGGVGLGVAGVDHEIRYLVANAAATGGNLQILLPSSETTYAYQLILGAELEATPRFSVTADVRYFDVGDVQVERYIGNTIINGTATSTGTLDSVLDADLASTTVTVGLRYRF